jgi:8-oxo-dGTP diphosphatase
MTVNEQYGNRIRVRACGVLLQDRTYLLVNHSGLNEENTFWHFPGGGVDPAETITQALKREFREETGLQIEVQDFIKTNEHIVPPLHAVEFFFKVKTIAGQLQVGQDPELPIVQGCAFFSKEEIFQMPKNQIASCIFDLIS